MVAEATQITNTKKCSDCLMTLPVAEFTPCAGCRQGVLPRCRACHRVRSAQYRADHPEVHRSSSAKWRNANPDRQRDACRAHYRKNTSYYKEKNARWAALNPGKMAAYSASHAAANPDRRRAAWRNFYHRHKMLPLSILRRRVTTRLRAFLKGRRKGFIAELGCSVECLRQHLELLFTAGMGWHNTDEWEIDHFYPLSAIGNAADWISVAAACNYRNLRPCWRSANRSKRATVLPEAERLFAAIKQLICEGRQ